MEIFFSFALVYAAGQPGFFLIGYSYKSCCWPFAIPFATQHRGNVQHPKGYKATAISCMTFTFASFVSIWGRVSDSYRSGRSLQSGQVRDVLCAGKTCRLCLRLPDTVLLTHFQPVPIPPLTSSCLLDQPVMKQRIDMSGHTRLF
jgi:hypothetical protein